MLFRLVIACQFEYERHVLEVFHCSWCWCGKYCYALKYIVVCLQNVVQVLAQSQAEAAHSQVEEDAKRQNQTCDDVKPLLAERTRVSMGCHDGVVVQIVQNLWVLTVAQVVDNILQLSHNLLYLLVVARTEEHVYRVGQMQQLVLFAILLNLFTYL